MSRGSSQELLEYARLTLRLVEQFQHRDEDAPIAGELKLALRRYIAELEQEATSRVHYPHTLKPTEPTSE